MAAEEQSAASLRLHLRQNMPLLRRFSRALTGDQQLADTAMVQVMEDLLFQASTFAVTANTRVTLYQQMLQNLAMITPVPTDCLPTPTSRQALLLTAVEGFSNGEAAEVLGVPSSELDHLLQRASNEMASQRGVRILIVEDQQFIATTLEFLVSQMGHEVVGITTTRSTAVGEARRTRPDLILSDIQLADGSSGLVAMDDIQNEQEIPYIIITAHPELLLTGRHREPTFVICKPFVGDSVAAVISQALFLHEARLMNAPPSLVDPVRS